MAARSIGSGTISFGLVSIPFKLYTAASPKGVSFNMLHDKCGCRMKQQYLCPVDNEVVDRKNMVRGFEHVRDSFVRFTEEELKALESARTNMLDLVEFVPLSTVDFVSIEKTYYLGPDKGGERAYRLLSEAMERMQRVAVGRYATRGKDNLVVVRPYKQGLVLHEVFYADEVRSFDEVETAGAFEFKPIEVELADKLINELSVPAFDSSKFEDTYAARVRAAVEQKVAGQEVVVAAEAPKAQIVDLLEALKRSVAGLKKNDSEAQAAPKSEPSPGPKKAGPKPETAAAKKKSAG
jgi:DNA end-binding protein Ku